MNKNGESTPRLTTTWLCPWHCRCATVTIHHQLSWMLACLQEKDTTWTSGLVVGGNINLLQFKGLIHFTSFSLSICTVDVTDANFAEILNLPSYANMFYKEFCMNIQPFHFKCTKMSQLFSLQKFPPYRTKRSMFFKYSSLHVMTSFRVEIQRFNFYFVL